MKNKNIWIILAAIYVFVIGGVVIFRMKNKPQTPQPIVTTPVSSTSTTPTKAMEQLYVEFEKTESKGTMQEVILQLLDPQTFESAGYTLEIMYEPNLIKITDIAVGDVWDKNVVLQKDLTSGPSKAIFSVGRGMDSKSTGGKVLAKLKIQVVDKNAATTQITLNQTSMSAANGEAKTIIAEPITVGLK